MNSIQVKSAFGSPYHYLPSCESTNSWLLEAHHRGEPLTEGTLVLTDHQSKGRGLRGTHWESEDSKNLLISFVIKPPLPKQLFWVSAAVALALRETVEQLLGKTCKVKWPNDVYHGQKKLAGILTETAYRGNYLDIMVIGVGLNVNQAYFSHLNATSLRALSGKEWKRELVLEQFLHTLERYLIKLRSFEPSIRTLLTPHLYGYGERLRFSGKEGKFLARVLGVSEEGKLALELEDGLHYYEHKQIQFLF